MPWVARRHYVEHLVGARGFLQRAAIRCANLPSPPPARRHPTSPLRLQNDRSSRARCASLSVQVGDGGFPAGAREGREGRWRTRRRPGSMRSRRREAKRSYLTCEEDRRASRAPRVAETPRDRDARSFPSAYICAWRG